MSLKYSIVARKNPSDTNAPKKYYPQAQSVGIADFKSLARRIQKNTGQSYADVTGVLAALEDALPEELLAGKIVRLGSLGSFYTTYKTIPGETPEEVSAKNIVEARIRYRPARSLLSEVNNSAKFEKVSTSVTTTTV